MRLNEHIERGHTVVCANVRLAHHFTHLYAQEQLRAHRRAWETPDILPWQAWLRRCWISLRERNAVGGLLLSGEQEIALWQQIIEQSDFRNSLLQGSSIAGQAAAAWQRLKQYRVPIFPQGTLMNEDVAAFKSWADQYRSRCLQNNWIDNASLADMLLEVSTADLEILGRGLVLVGFDQLTPQQTMLFKRMENASILVHEQREAGRNASVKLRNFADADEEIRAAALWARRCIEEESGVTVGIITPDLRKLRTRIHYIFEDVLYPGNLRYRDTATNLSFSISAGQPLADYPLINAIFPILGLNKAPLALDTLGVLLRSPFIKGHDTERGGRALLDEELRSRNQLAINWDDLLYLAGVAGDKGRPIPIMKAMLHEILSVLAELPAKQSPEDWTDSFNRFLEIFGWPGERSLHSTEYQQVRSWHSVLDSFVSLRLVFPVISHSDALSHLRRIAGGIGFQPKTAETPIQVLEPQGAAAMDFDRVWMLGLTEEVWPPRPRPNPFVPIAVQKKHGMPGADADNNLQQARNLQTALVSSAPEIILSHARNEEDRPLLASPLLQTPPLPDHAEMSEPSHRIDKPAVVDITDEKVQLDRYSQVIFSSRRIELITDTAAPPVAGLHSGGVSLFRDQSQCPFRAFARHRLHSRQLQQADIGLDSMQRGNLLHELMENTWTRLESQGRLAAMTNEERENFVKTLVGDLIADYRKRYPLVFSKRFAGIEAIRLAQVLGDWLELELQRSPFEVADVEEDARLAIGDVEFTARLDRVDILEDGRHVIIDYKSGQANIYAWAGDRPDEPQMPLYAVTHPEPVAAVAFARLKRGSEFGFAGLAESDAILPDTGAFGQDRRVKRFIPDREAQSGALSLSWEEMFDNWRAVLENLTNEFRQGVASVSPKPRACDWCDQHLLCRIHEVSQK